MSEPKWEIHGGVRYPSSEAGGGQDKDAGSETFTFEGKEYITLCDLSFHDALKIHEGRFNSRAQITLGDHGYLFCDDSIDDGKFSSAASLIQKFYRNSQKI